MKKRFQGGRWRWAPWVAVVACASAEARAQAPAPPIAAPVAAPAAPIAAPVAAPIAAPDAPVVAPDAPVVAPAALVAAPVAPPASVPVVAPAVPVAAPAAPVVAKPPLAWAGTTFDWGTLLSAGILGVGPSYIGTEGEQVLMTWGVTPSYFVFWRPRHQLSVSAHVAVEVELTNSDTTTKKHQAEIADVPLGLDYAATLFTRGHGPTLGGVRAMHDPTLLGEGDWRTWALVSTYLVLPASPESRAAGVDLGTSVGAALRQQIPLLGGESRWLSYLLITASERWSHAFTSESTSNGSGPPGLLEGVYSFGPAVVPNTLRHALSFTLPIYRDLQLDTSFQLRHGFPASVGLGGTGCIQIATGCVSQAPVQAGVVRTSTRFVLGLSYAIIPELGIALGYVNDASSIGDDGTKRGIFYSPEARFYTNVTFSFDRFYQRLAAPAGPRI
jgi:hypothetical protein